MQSHLVLISSLLSASTLPSFSEWEASQWQKCTRYQAQMQVIDQVGGFPRIESMTLRSVSLDHTEKIHAFLLGWPNEGRVSFELLSAFHHEKDRFEQKHFFANSPGLLTPKTKLHLIEKQMKAKSGDSQWECEITGALSESCNLYSSEFWLRLAGRPKETQSLPTNDQETLTN